MRRQVSTTASRMAKSATSTARPPSAHCARFTGKVLPPVIPPTDKLSDVFVYLNETSLSQLRRDYKTGHLDHKITNALH